MPLSSCLEGVGTHIDIADADTPGHICGVDESQRMWWWSVAAGNSSLCCSASIFDAVEVVCSLSLMELAQP